MPAMRSAPSARAAFSSVHPQGAERALADLTLADATLADVTMAQV
jgi:hypothetical protein